jgi:hypothetical protein
VFLISYQGKNSFLFLGLKKQTLYRHIFSPIASNIAFGVALVNAFLEPVEGFYCHKMAKYVEEKPDG